MENKEIAKQMLELHKTSFKKSFLTMAAIQNQADILTNTVANHTPGMNDEDKKIIDQWTDAYMKGVDNFKEAID